MSSPLDEGASALARVAVPGRELLNDATAGQSPLWPSPGDRPGDIRTTYRLQPGRYGAGMVGIEKNKRLSDADLEQLGGRLAKGYAKGSSIAALAQEHGTSLGRVRLILLERGVVLRPRGGNTRRRIRPGSSRPRPSPGSTAAARRSPTWAGRTG